MIHLPTPKMKRLLLLILLPLLLLSDPMQAQVRAPVLRTPTITTAVVGGTVPSGARKITFLISSDFSGTILGATFAGPSDTSVSFDAPFGDALRAIPYTRASGTLRIIQVR